MNRRYLSSGKLYYNHSRNVGATARHDAEIEDCMALVNCKECGKEISTEAKVCPHCGAKVSRKTGVGTITLALVIGFVVFKCVSTTQERMDEAAASSSNTPAQSSAAIATWQYGSTKDAMSGAEVKTADLVAKHGISLEFPYAGRNMPVLALRRQGASQDVMVSIEKGQIICPPSSCSVLVRFDNDKAASFSAAHPADHSSTMLFLSPEKRFIERLKKSKKTLVELNLYQAGTQVIEFNTAGLEWPAK